MQVTVEPEVVTVTVRPAAEDEIQNIMDALRRKLAPAAQAVENATQLAGGTVDGKGNLWGLYAEVDRARHVLDDAVFALRCASAQLKAMMRRQGAECKLQKGDTMINSTVDKIMETAPSTWEKATVYRVVPADDLEGVEYTGENADAVLYFAGGDESPLLFLDPEDETRLCSYTADGELTPVSPGTWILHFASDEDGRHCIMQTAAEMKMHWKVQRRIGGIGRRDQD